MSDEQSIRDVVRRWDAAWNAHDMAAMAALLTEHADFVNVAGLHWKGRAQIESEHAERHRTNVKESVSATRNVDVQMLSPVIALVYIDWRMSGDKDFDGAARSPRQGIFTWVMEKGTRVVADPGGTEHQHHSQKVSLPHQGRGTACVT